MLADMALRAAIHGTEASIGNPRGSQYIFLVLVSAYLRAPVRCDLDGYSDSFAFASASRSGRPA
jgi:hypothetical protein